MENQKALDTFVVATVIFLIAAIVAPDETAETLSKHFKQSKHKKNDEKHYSAAQEIIVKVVDKPIQQIENTKQVGVIRAFTRSIIKHVNRFWKWLY